MVGGVSGIRQPVRVSKRLVVVSSNNVERDRCQSVQCRIVQLQLIGVAVVSEVSGNTNELRPQVLEQRNGSVEIVDAVAAVIRPEMDIRRNAEGIQLVPQRNIPAGGDGLDAGRQVFADLLLGHGGALRQGGRVGRLDVGGNTVDLRLNAHGHAPSDQSQGGLNIAGQ